MSTYNGWSNYATWRVNLELIDGFQINADTPYETLDLAVYLRETAILAVDNSCPDLGGIAWDYAMAFLDEVNWQEIAKHKIEELTPADWEQLTRIAALLNQRKSA